MWRKCWGERRGGLLVGRREVRRSPKTESQKDRGKSGESEGESQNQKFKLLKRYV